LSTRKLLAFRLIAVLLPILLVAAIELSLRLYGFGGYAPMFRKLGPVKGGNLVVAEQGGAQSWFFANSDRAGTSEQYTFVDPKPTNTVRVVLVGESAIQGYPQPRHLCASAFLQLMLQDAWPDRRVEVINIGTTAIASFPVLEIMTEALDYEPDLVVVYTGHNEFFGTYGVASVGHAGSRPWMLKTTRWLNSLAIVQALRKARHRQDSAQDRTLMEEMMERTYVGPDDWRRRAAANTLYQNVAQMIRRCEALGAGVLICTPPTNERGLAPIGVDKLDRLPSETRQEVIALLSTAEAERRARPALAIPALQRILQLDPTHARAHYLLGQALTDQARHSEALAQYVAARDLDTMPWRAPSQSLKAILRAAQEQNAPICDLVQVFRTNSPGQAIGWELMDDHVHPTLRGQALIAEAIVERLGDFQGKLHLAPEACARLPGWEEYAQRLGTNIYDQYAVAHNMRMVFSAAFMRRNNAETFVRFNDIATGIEKQFAPEIRDVLHEWQATRPYAGSRCPVTAAVAQLLLKQDKYKEALDLYEIAQRAVPPYTSWYLEYTYYGLLCRQKLSGGLGVAERQQAQTAIEQGHFLLEHGASHNDFTLHYTGLLHYLCREFTNAIPCFQAVQAQETGIDRLAVDQALFVCYLQTFQFDKAREVLTSGAAAGGEFAERYQALLRQLPALEKVRMGATNSTGRLPK
jgi:tetratricopeptide (TPR) repeat protein